MGEAGVRQVLSKSLWPSHAACCADLLLCALPRAGQAPQHQALRAPRGPGGRHHQRHPGGCAQGRCRQRRPQEGGAPRQSWLNEQQHSSADVGLVHRPTPYALLLSPRLADCLACAAAPLRIWSTGGALGIWRPGKLMKADACACAGAGCERLPGGRAAEGARRRQQPAAGAAAGGAGRRSWQSLSGQHSGLPVCAHCLVICLVRRQSYLVIRTRTTAHESPANGPSEAEWKLAGLTAC